MPELAGVALLAERLDIVSTRFATSKARNDVIQLKTICGTAAPACLLKKVRVLLAPELFCFRWHVVSLMKVIAALNAAKVEKAVGAVSHNLKFHSAFRAGDGGSASVAETIAHAGAILAKPLGKKLCPDFELLSARLTRCGGGFLPEHGCARPGARPGRPLSKMARRLVELTGTHCAGLVCGFLVPWHGVDHLWSLEGRG